MGPMRQGPTVLTLELCANLRRLTVVAQQTDRYSLALPSLSPGNITLRQPHNASNMAQSIGSDHPTPHFGGVWTSPNLGPKSKAMHQL